MKVLVTGGAGFVGSHLVDRLIENGHEVIVVDHHQKDKKRYPNPQAKIHKLKFADSSIEEIFALEKPDAVCHLAAQIDVNRSVADPIYDAQTNILDSLSLLEAAKRHGTHKFVFASSGGAIYGDHPELPTPEVMNARPISPYGVSKQAFEHYLNSSQNEGAMNSTILRFSNLYGPRQVPHGGAGNVIGLFITQMLRGEPCTIFGNGSATRDYLYVDDAVNAFLSALTHDFSGTLNISSGREVSTKQLWDELNRLHGGESIVKFAPDRPGDVYRSCLSSTAAEKELGWRPKTTFEQGLAATYNWFVENLSE